jgi:hypothetical protein
VTRLNDPPGHARHHHCIWDARSAGWFTGDTFGLSYREFDTAKGAWIVPTSTPVQFEPEALRASVLRMAAMEPECLYLTHYSRVTDVPRLTSLVLGLLVINSGEIQHEDVIAQAVVVTVTLSLVLHSVTARPGIRWLSARGSAVAPLSAGD